MTDSVSKEEKFRSAEPVTCGLLTFASSEKREEGLMDISSLCDSVVLNVTEARALRDFLDRILP